MSAVVSRSDLVQLSDLPSPKGLPLLGNALHAAPAPDPRGVEPGAGHLLLDRNFSIELATDAAAIMEVAAFTMIPSAMPMRLKSLNQVPPEHP